MKTKNHYLNRMWFFFVKSKLQKLNQSLHLENLLKSEIIENNSEQIVFGVSNQASINYIQKNKLADAFLQKIQSKIKQISFVVTPFEKTENKTNLISENNTNLIENKTTNKIILNIDKSIVVGDFNRKIIEIIERMLNGESFWSPLFIYSHSGLGKTSILNLVKNVLPKNDVWYTSGFEFVSEVFEKLTLSGFEIEKWKKEINKYKVYLFDDIHLLSNKTKTNEILFQIIDYALKRNKIVIFTAEIHPEDFVGFEKRLKSRFQKGLLLEIKKPNLLVSAKIVRQKIRFFCPKMQMKEDVINIIAQNYANDIRKLEGIIKRLSFQWEFDGLNNTQIDIKSIKQIFGKRKWNDQSNKITINQIFNIVANYYNVSRKDLTSLSRKQQIVKIRYIAMYLMRNLTLSTCLKIAKLFHLKNHASVLTAVKIIKRRKSQEKSVAKDIEIIIKKCKKPINNH